MEAPNMNLVWGYEIERAARYRTKKEKNFVWGLAIVGVLLIGLGKDWRVFLGLLVLLPLAAWAYTKIRESQVRAELLVQQSYALQAISFLNFKRPIQFGRWAILPDLAEILVHLMAEHKPRVVLELGSGTSTLILAYCRKVMNLGCQIISVESEAAFAEETRKLLWDHGLGDSVTIIVAPLVATMVGEQTFQWFDDTNGWLETLPPVDLLLVDGPPGKIQKLSRHPALPKLWQRLSGDPIIVLDDGYRPDEQKIAELWSAVLAGLDATFLPTLKGCWLWRKKAH